jgi:hypothetical protein
MNIPTQAKTGIEWAILWNCSIMTCAFFGSSTEAIKVIVLRRVVRPAFAAPALVTLVFRFICLYAQYCTDNSASTIRS